MRKEFTTREKIYLVIFAFLIIGLVYYEFVLTPINTQISEYTANQAAEQSIVDVNLVRLAQKNKMQKYLDNLPDDAKSLPEYDNSTNLMLELHAILAEAESYSLSFSQTTEENYIVKRGIGLTFTASDYIQARRIIDSLASGKNVMQISDVSISLSTGTSKGTANVSLNLTYYEMNYDN